MKYNKKQITKKNNLSNTKSLFINLIKVLKGILLSIE